MEDYPDDPYDSDGPYDPYYHLIQQSERAFDNLFATEKEFMASEGYYANNNLADFRRPALFFIADISWSENFDVFVPYLAMTYCDRVASRKKVPVVLLSADNQENLTLFLICCVTLAWKMRTRKFSILEFLNERNLITYGINNVARMEMAICFALEWRMRTLTPICFADYFIPLLHLQHGQVFRRRPVRRIIVKVQANIGLTQYKPSVVAASAVLIASSRFFPNDFSQFFSTICSDKYLKDSAGEMVDCMYTIELLLMPRRAPPEPGPIVEPSNSGVETSQPVESASEPPEPGPSEATSSSEGGTSQSVESASEPPGPGRSEAQSSGVGTSEPAESTPEPPGPRAYKPSDSIPIPGARPRYSPSESSDMPSDESSPKQGATGLSGLKSDESTLSPSLLYEGSSLSPRASPPTSEPISVPSQEQEGDPSGSTKNEEITPTSLQPQASLPPGARPYRSTGPIDISGPRPYYNPTEPRIDDVTSPGWSSSEQRATGLSGTKSADDTFSLKLLFEGDSLSPRASPPHKRSKPIEENSSSLHQPPIEEPSSSLQQPQASPCKPNEPIDIPGPRPYYSPTEPPIDDMSSGGSKSEDKSSSRLQFSLSPRASEPIEQISTSLQQPRVSLPPGPRPYRPTEQMDIPGFRPYYSPTEPIYDVSSTGSKSEETSSSHILQFSLSPRARSYEPSESTPVPIKGSTKLDPIHDPFEVSQKEVGEPSATKNDNISSSPGANPDNRSEPVVVSEEKWRKLLQSALPPETTLEDIMRARGNEPWMEEAEGVHDEMMDFQLEWTEDDVAPTNPNTTGCCCTIQ